MAGQQLVLLLMTMLLMLQLVVHVRCMAILERRGRVWTAERVSHMQAWMPRAAHQQCLQAQRSCRYGCAPLTTNVSQSLYNR